MFTWNKNKNMTSLIVMTLLLLGMISILLYCFSGGISGNDFWWHIKVGEWIIENGCVPMNDIFSWYGTSMNIEWTAHEWLAEVVFYFIYTIGGEIGIFVFSILSALLLVFLTFRKAKEYVIKNFLIGGLFFALFCVVVSLFFYGRPHVFSYFLLFFELSFLYDFQENQNSKKIYIIPILAILWSNLHGGSSNLSYILCIVFIIANLFDFELGRVGADRFEPKALRKLSVITIVTMGAIMLNPLGVRVFSFPYINVGDSLSTSIISEWQTPDPKRIGDLVLYFLPIVVMSVGIFSEKKKKIALIDVLIMLFFICLFLRSKRFIALWYIAAPFYAFKYVPEIKIKDITRYYEKIAVGIVGGLLCLTIGMAFKNIYNTNQTKDLISKTVSDEIIETVREDTSEHIFNDYNLGEALIYNDIPVFFDARADMYLQDNILADGVGLMLLQSLDGNSEKGYFDVDAIIEKYQFESVLILKSRPLYSYIKSHPEQFRMICEDEEVGYYKILKGDS